MTADRLAIGMKANAVFDLGAGLLLLTGTWDGLWNALDLPQGRPALFVQVGGAVLIGLAYVLWRAASEPALHAPLALGTAIADTLATLVILVWLVSGRLEGVGALGTTLLVLTALALAAFAALKASIGRAVE